jgi:hypothetical protein
LFSRSVSGVVVAYTAANCRHDHQNTYGDNGCEFWALSAYRANSQFFVYVFQFFTSLYHIEDTAFSLGRISSE